MRRVWWRIVSLCASCGLLFMTWFVVLNPCVVFFCGIVYFALRVLFKEDKDFSSSIEFVRILVR